MTGNSKIKKSDIIIEAAVELFAKKNFKEVPVSEIAEHAGVAVGTVYEHFKNKEDLYFSIPLKSADHFGEQLRLHLEGLHSPVEKIRKYIWYYLYFNENNPIFTELLLMELRVNKNFYNTRKSRGLLKSTSVILNLIKEGQEQEEIRNDISPFMIRHMILGILEHTTTYWLLNNCKNDIVSQGKDITNLILSAIIIKKENGQPTDQPE
jgi:TetR/AcrR family fatty acid metabolism transcriptional regulator